VSFFDSKNPTPLTIGKTGKLDGKPCTVVGRMVLRSSDGYRWNEYLLRSEDGTEATLVFESGIWKIFVQFEPTTSLSSAIAQQQKIGRRIVLANTQAVVSYVGRSEVVHTEGSVPPHIHRGSTAAYFNADSSMGEHVVSWTGEEVEHYLGRNLAAGFVERVFGLPRTLSQGILFSGTSQSSAVGGLISNQTKAIIGLAVLIVAAAFIASIGNLGEDASPIGQPPDRRPAPAMQLADHAQGTLAGHRYTVTGHWLCDIAAPDGRYGRHEYDLADESGNSALLIQSLDGAVNHWHILTPIPTPDGFTPERAGAVRLGGTVSVGSKQTKAHILFMSRTTAAQGTATDTPYTDSPRYGFVATEGGQWLLARWTAKEISFHLGQAVSEKEVLAAFGAGVGR
jgi:hypothetical protein